MFIERSNTDSSAISVAIEKTGFEFQGTQGPHHTVDESRELADPGFEPVEAPKSTPVRIAKFQLFVEEEPVHPNNKIIVTPRGACIDDEVPRGLVGRRRYRPHGIRFHGFVVHLYSNPNASDACDSRPSIPSAHIEGAVRSVQ